MLELGDPVCAIGLMEHKVELKWFERVKALDRVIHVASIWHHLSYAVVNLAISLRSGGIVSCEELDAIDGVVRGNSAHVS